MEPQSLDLPESAQQHKTETHLREVSPNEEQQQDQQQQQQQGQEQQQQQKHDMLYPSLSLTGSHQLVRRRTLKSPKASPHRCENNSPGGGPPESPQGSPQGGFPEHSRENVRNGQREKETTISGEHRKDDVSKMRTRQRDRYRKSCRSSSRNSSSSSVLSCAPWRVSLVVEAFDGCASICPLCCPGFAAAESDTDLAAAAASPAAAAAVHRDDSTSVGSSREFGFLESSSRRESLSSDKSSSSSSISNGTTSSGNNSSDPFPFTTSFARSLLLRSSKSSSKSSRNIFCCSCTQVWVEVQDVRGPGVSSQLRLLGDPLSMPRLLSPPILLPKQMKQVQFRLYRRRLVQQQRHQQQQQPQQWVEEREHLGVRAVSLPDAPSCVVTGTFGIAGCKTIAPASATLLSRSLNLAAAAAALQNQDFDFRNSEWQQLRRVPGFEFQPGGPPFLEGEGAPSLTGGALGVVCAGLRPACRWLRRSLSRCGRLGARVVGGAASGVYMEMLEGTDCLRLVASDRFALILYEP